MTLTISDEVVRATGMSEDDLRLELAVHLFQLDRLTLGGAARLACTSQAEFMQVLGRRRIPIHYGIEELEQDLRTLEELRRR